MLPRAPTLGGKLHSHTVAAELYADWFATKALIIFHNLIKQGRIPFKGGRLGIYLFIYASIQVEGSSPMLTALVDSGPNQELFPDCLKPVSHQNTA